MKRREALKVSAGTLAIWTLSGASISAVMSSCKTDTGPDWTPSALDTAQMDLVEELCEMIMPATSTPGARDALVHRYVDEAIHSYFTQDEKDQFIQGISVLDQMAKDQGAKSFTKADVEVRTAILDALVVEADKFQPTDTADKHFFYAFRDFVKHAFFSSEVGATQVLKYDPVPGMYKGCIPLNEVGGTWF